MLYAALDRLAEAELVDAGRRRSSMPNPPLLPPHRPCQRALRAEAARMAQAAQLVTGHRPRPSIAPELAAHRARRDLDHRQGSRWLVSAAAALAMVAAARGSFRAGLALLLVALAWASIDPRPTIAAAV